MVDRLKINKKRTAVVAQSSQLYFGGIGKLCGGGIERQLDADDLNFDGQQVVSMNESMRVLLLMMLLTAEKGVLHQHGSFLCSTELFAR